MSCSFLLRGSSQPRDQTHVFSTCCCCCQVTSVVSNFVQPHRRQPTRLPRPWDSPGKNTGVACHFLLQCMKVKYEREVAQSCLTLHDPMDCSLLGSSVHGIFQARVLEWGAIAFSHEFHSQLKISHFPFPTFYLFPYYLTCIAPLAVNTSKGRTVSLPPCPDPITAS